MSLSSGTRTLLGEAASWTVAAMMCAGALIYFDELKGVAHAILGTAPPSMSAATGEPILDPAPSSHATSETGGFVVELEAGGGGHYHAEAEINGREIEVLVDTGATLVALTYEDAERAGIFITDKDFTHTSSTANGSARVAPVMLDRVSIGPITVRNVRGMVSEPGALGISLLGMSFLGQLDRVDMRSGRLVLED